MKTKNPNRNIRCQETHFSKRKERKARQKQAQDFLGGGGKGE